MSMEAQFYEARRKQGILDRRNSLRTEYEIPKPKLLPAPALPKSSRNDKAEFYTLQIPIRIFRRSSDRQISFSSIPSHRAKIVHTDQSLFRRDRDIYPRSTTQGHRFINGAVLLKRFSSTEYLQQR